MSVKCNVWCVYLQSANLQGVKMLCTNAEGATLKGCNFEDPAGIKANLEGGCEGFRFLGVVRRILADTDMMYRTNQEKLEQSSSKAFKTLGDCSLELLLVFWCLRIVKLSMETLSVIIAL